MVHQRNDNAWAESVQSSFEKRNAMRKVLERRESAIRSRMPDQSKEFWPARSQIGLVSILAMVDLSLIMFIIKVAFFRH